MPPAPAAPPDAPIEDPPAPDAAPLDEAGVEDEPEPVGLLAAPAPAPMPDALPVLPALVEGEAEAVGLEAEPGIGDTVGLVPEGVGAALVAPPVDDPLALIGDAGFCAEDELPPMPNACLEPSEAVLEDDGAEALDEAVEVPDVLGAEDEDVAEDPELLLKLPLEGRTPAIESDSDLPESEVPAPWLFVDVDAELDGFALDEPTESMALRALDSA